MTTSQAIFISAVSQEVPGARDLVAKSLLRIGYEPVWQDAFGGEQGDLLGVLRGKIDACRGLIQLVGYRYGNEPPAGGGDFGRVSYTQFEALYARQQGKKVWYLLDVTPPAADSGLDEPEELRLLQQRYRKGIQADTALYREVDLKNEDALKIAVFEISDSLAKLRCAFKIWTAAVTTLLLVILALLLWNRLDPGSPPCAEVTEDQANAAFLSKDRAAAFEAYARLSEADPGNIGYHRRVEESARMGSLQKALLDHYLALTRIHPDNAVLQNYLGNAYLMIDPVDKDGKGRTCYESALRLDPQSSLPLANLGVLAARDGRRDEAQELFERYLAACPGDAPAWVNLGLLHLERFQKDHGDEASLAAVETSLDKAIRIDPGSAAAYKALGRLRMATGRKDEAVDAYRRSLVLNPEQPGLRDLLADESGDSHARTPQGDDFVTRGGKPEPPGEPAKPAGNRGTAE